MIRAAFSIFCRRFAAASARTHFSSAAAVAVRTRGSNASSIAAAAAVLGCASVLAFEQRQRQPAQAASKAAGVLSKHFVADAAAQAAPAVVNILSVVKSKPWQARYEVMIVLGSVGRA